MEVEIYQVDAFTSELFKGNPAGVCITKEPLSEPLMLSIASEMALSETAFLTLSDMRLRWFTPEVEVKLCGHGTLSVVNVMKEQGLVQVGDTIAFQTLSGELIAKVGESSTELDFPAPELDFTLPVNEDLLSNLGLSRDDVVAYCGFTSKVLIQVKCEQVVHDIKPNFSGLKSIEGRGVVVTASSEQSSLDFVSRYFAPWVGIDEDPVTGSAHCRLTQFWAQATSRTQFSAYQASARGGYLSTELTPNGRVKLVGDCRTILRGTMIVA
ncbi:PhzF family phenazine biosynthesis protein [Vibrio paucivorans]